jgi:hypothetical protein
MPVRGNPPAFLTRSTTSEVSETLLNTSIRARNDKARQVLGWKPRYPSFRAGIDHALLLSRAGETV